jgi:hypothetical protein
MKKSLIKQELSFGGTEGVEESDDEQVLLQTVVSVVVSDHDSDQGVISPTPTFEDLSDNERTVPTRSVEIVPVDTLEEFIDLECGDHVYMWSKMRQLHGLVVQVDDDGTALIADFSVPPTGMDESASGDDDGPEVVIFQFRREHSEHTKWRKVQYGVNKWERAVRPPGTCTCEIASTQKTVLDRLNFLMLHYQLVPRSHAVISNSETLAFWCTTGQWRALQMNQLLDISNTASVVGTGSLATYAVAESAGLCCLLGAELAISAPLLLPAIAVGSLAAGGATVWNTHRMRREWKNTTELLNVEFDRFQLLHEEGLAEPSLEEIDAELQFREVLSLKPTAARTTEASSRVDLSFFRKQRPKSAQLKLV